MFSVNGNLGAASEDNCYYVFDPNGNLLNKGCGDWNMHDASFSNGKFGFVNLDGYAYIAYENGTLWKKVEVGSYDWAITMLPNGFIACGSRCAHFDFNGNEKWSAYVREVNHGPSVREGYVYVTSHEYQGIGTNALHVFKLSNGSKVKEISYDEEAKDSAVCGSYLVVVTERHLYLYDLSDPVNPRELWKVIGGGHQVTFSPGCDHVAVAGWGTLKIYDVQGREVFEKSYGTWAIDAIAWWKDEIAIGLDNDEIHVYRIEGYASIPRSLSINATQATVTLTVTKTITVTTTLTTTSTTTITMSKTISNR